MYDVWLQKSFMLNPWPTEVTQAAYPAEMLIDLRLAKDFMWSTEEEETGSKGWGQLSDAVADVVENKQIFSL